MNATRPGMIEDNPSADESRLLKVLKTAVAELAIANREHRVKGYAVLSAEKDLWAARHNNGQQVTPDKPKNKGGRPRTMSDATVATIRKMRDAGFSYQGIADNLNGGGIPGPHGGKWFKQSAHLAWHRYCKPSSI